jgi:hypothetical protein
MAQFFARWRNWRGTVEDGLTTKERRHKGGNFLTAKYAKYANSQPKLNPIAEIEKRAKAKGRGGARR